MFLSKNYILANELIQKMQINIANISVLKQRYENADDYSTFLKMNNCTFINTKSASLPKNIKMGIATNDFTDFTDKLPCTYVRTEFGVKEDNWIKSGIVTEKIKIADKQFYQFCPDFVKTMKNKIAYILDEKEARCCKREGDIDGYIQLSKDQYFTWYGINNGLDVCNDNLIESNDNEKYYISQR